MSTVHTCSYYCQEGTHTAKILCPETWSREEILAFYATGGIMPEDKECLAIRPAREVDLASWAREMVQRIDPLTQQRTPLAPDDPPLLTSGMVPYLLLWRWRDDQEAPDAAKG